MSVEPLPHEIPQIDAIIRSLRGGRARVFAVVAFDHRDEAVTMAARLAKGMERKAGKPVPRIATPAEFLISGASRGESDLFKGIGAACQFHGVTWAEVDSVIGRVDPCDR